MEQIMIDLQTKFPAIHFSYVQSNHEGDIIDQLQTSDHDAIVLNAGGYTHTSVAIRDAIEAIPAPVIEVHLSNIEQREAFRQVDMIREVCQQLFIGLDCYEKAINYITANL